MVLCLFDYQGLFCSSKPSYNENLLPKLGSICRIFQIGKAVQSFDYELYIELFMYEQILFAVWNLQISCFINFGSLIYL